MLSTALISGVVSVVVAGVTTFATIQVTKMQLAEKEEELQLQRRSERLENYQTAINLLTDWGWRRSERKYDEAIVREFTIPFVRAANRVPVYGSPGSIAAMDEIQNGFRMLNRAKGESEQAAAEKGNPRRSRSPRHRCTGRCWTAQRGWFEGCPISPGGWALSILT